MSSTSTSTESGLPVYDTADPGLWREGLAAPPQNGSPQEWHETPQQQIPVPVSSNGTVSGFYNGLSFNSNGNITSNQHSVPNESHSAGGYAMNGVRLPTNLAYPHSMVNGNGYVNPIANAPYLRAPGWVVTKKVTNGIKKQKRNRTAFTTQQMMELEQEYARARYLDRNRRIELSEALNLNQRTIKIWFQNRRMKEKKDRAESLEEANHSNSTKSSPELIEDAMPMLMNEQYPLNVSPNDVYNLRGMYIDQYQLQGTFPPTPVHTAAQPQIQSFVEYAPESHYEAQPQCKQVHLQVDNYEPNYNNGLEAMPQLPQDPTPLNRCSTAAPAESNWDLSWIRNITIDEEIHGN